MVTKTNKTAAKTKTARAKIVSKSDSRKRVVKKYDDGQVITLLKQENARKSGGVAEGWKVLKALKTKTVGNFVARMSGTKLADRSRSFLPHWKIRGYINIK
jgi:hypothetical protein